MIRPILTLLGWKGVLALVSTLMLATGGAGYLMYNKGYDAGEAALQSDFDIQKANQNAELYKLSAKLVEQSAQMERERSEQSQRIRELEDEAINDPDAVKRKPSPASVRRLQRRWPKD